MGRITLMAVILLSITVSGKFWGFDPKLLRDSFINYMYNYLHQHAPQVDPSLKEIMESNFTALLNNTLLLEKYSLTRTDFVDSFKHAYSEINQEVQSVKSKRCIEKVFVSLFHPTSNFPLEGISALLNVLSYQQIKARTLPRLESFKGVNFDMQKSMVVAALEKASKDNITRGEVNIERLRRFKEDILRNYPGNLKLTDSIRFFFFLSDAEILAETVASCNCSVRTKQLMEFSGKLIAELGYNHLSEQFMEFYQNMNASIIDPVDLVEASHKFLACLR